jgi:hypothetical protein
MAKSLKVVTGKVRFSYAHVFEPQAAQEGGTPKYSVSIIIPKSDKDTIDRINKAIESVKEDNKAVWGGKIPPMLKGGLRDGDAEKPDDAAYKNAYFINANSQQKPGVVDQDLNPIMDRAEFYSGCYGRASISFFAYNSNGSKGVGCGLNNVQKMEDGEKLGGATTAAEDFAV